MFSPIIFPFPSKKDESKLQSSPRILAFFLQKIADNGSEMINKAIFHLRMARSLLWPICMYIEHVLEILRSQFEASRIS